MQNLHTAVATDTQEAAKVSSSFDNQANPKALKVCIMTADFWGLKSAGGTATAYHLLAAVLAKSKGLHVSNLQISLCLVCCQYCTVSSSFEVKYAELAYDLIGQGIHL